MKSLVGYTLKTYVLCEFMYLFLVYTRQKNHLDHTHTEIIISEEGADT